MISTPYSTNTDARRAILISAPLLINWLLNGFYLTTLRDNLLWFFVVDGVAFVVGPVIVVLLLRRFCNITLQDLGFTERTQYSVRNLLDDSVVFIVIWLTVYWISKGILWAYLWKYDWVQASDAAFFSYRSVQMGLAGAILVPYFAASAAFAEELYFRGFLHFAAKSLVPVRFTNITFVFVSAALFGLIHWEGGLTKLLATTIIGLVAARQYLWRRSIWPLMVAHFITDLVFG